MRTTTAQESLWVATPGDATAYPAATGDLTVDVAVVGGGITGLTTALLLKREGLRVAVLEAGRVAEGASGNNTAKVTALQGTVYSTLINQHGVEVAAGYAEANLAGVDALADLVESERIPCDPRRRPAFTYAISTTAFCTRCRCAAPISAAWSASTAPRPAGTDRLEAHRTGGGAEREGDSELAEFFRRARGESRKGAEQGKVLLGKRLGSGLSERRVTGAAGQQGTRRPPPCARHHRHPYGPRESVHTGQFKSDSGLPVGQVVRTGSPRSAPPSAAQEGPAQACPAGTLKKVADALPS